MPRLRHNEQEIGHYACDLFQLITNLAVSNFYTFV
jgi:hypothetical protein